MCGVLLRRLWTSCLAWLLWLDPGPTWVGLGSAALWALAAKSWGCEEAVWLRLEVPQMLIRKLLSGRRALG